MISRILRLTLIWILVLGGGLLTLNRFQPELVSQYIFHSAAGQPNPLTLFMAKLTGNSENLPNGFSEEFHSGAEQADQQTVQQDAIEMNTPQIKTMYRWVDDKGRTQFTETAPTDRAFEEMAYQKEPARPSTAPRYKAPPAFTPNQSTNRAPQAQNNESDIEIDVPLQCQGKLNQLESYEQKLDKAKDVVESIWLQDYCSALSELILEGCVLPKASVKYNRYCPMRYR